MRLLLTVVGVLASLVLLFVSGSMNYLFMASLGKTPIEGQVFGGASAAADVLKALLPFFVAWSFASKKWLQGVIGSGVFLFFTAFSVASAIGFAADNRGSFSTTREGLNAQYESVQADIAKEQAKRQALPAHRVASVIEQDLKRLKQNRRWSSTRGCADGRVTASKSRVFCDGYFAMRAELASAVEAQRVDANLTELTAQAVRLKKAGAGQDVDPQISILSRLFSLDESLVRTTMIVVAALLVEVGSGLGLFLATGHTDRDRLKRAKMASSRVRSDEVDDGRSTQIEPLPHPRSEPSISRFTPAQIGRDTTEIETVGDIEDYCLERLQPTAEGGLALPAIFADYQHWCAARGVSAAGQGTFASDFERIAEAVEIGKRGAMYVGVKLGEPVGAVSRRAG